jgi:hypothetical protein
MMEAVRVSETSVNIYQTTRRNILEDSHIEPVKRLSGILFEYRIRLEILTNFFVVFVITSRRI